MERRARLREAAALKDLALEQHGSDEAVSAMKRHKAILAELEPLSAADYAVIAEAEREYARERGDG